jgi:hypothetical protein
MTNPDSFGASTIQVKHLFAIAITIYITKKTTKTGQKKGLVSKLTPDFVLTESIEVFSV